MRITIDLSDEELAELLEATGLKDPAEAVRHAVVEHVNWVHRMQITELEGVIEFQPTWEEMYGRDPEDGRASENR